jgi:tetratricopeptide (TPR) repeat protein
MDLQGEFKRLMTLSSEAFSSGQKRRSAEAARAAAKIAEAMGDHQRRVNALAWEGECLAHVGDKEAALVVLLEAANVTHHLVDPADTFRARTQLIEIAADIKPRADVVSLIDSCRGFLEQVGKESWDPILDSLQGDLEFSRGDYSLALDYALRAWRRYSESDPCFTKASHLCNLCRTAFRLRNTNGLRQYLREWGQFDSETEIAEIWKIRAETLLGRAERTWQSDPERALGSSRTLLRRASAVDVQMEACLDAMRLLALCGAFEEVDLHWKRYSSKLKRANFWDRLCEADLDLMYARWLAGMPPIDDEWDTEFPMPQPPFARRSECLTKLDRGEELYRNLSDLAATEDTRLETGHYSRTLRERVERLRMIRVALEAEQ